MNRVVRWETFGSPDVLHIERYPVPHPGVGEVRVRVSAVGVNPLDVLICASPAAATERGIVPPAGFGFDFAGVVDEVGPGCSDYAAGDRVFGRALARAAADFLVMSATPSTYSWLAGIPHGVTDCVAAALPTPGLTATAVLRTIGLRCGDSVLIGGAAGGVGVLTTQMARLAGADVIGTASRGTFDFLRELGAEPVEYGLGLADRLRAMGRSGLTCVADLIGSEAAEAGLALGVSRDRICTIAAGADPPGGVRATGGRDARPADLRQITDAVVAGRLTVPIAAVFSLDRVRDAAELQAARHTHGKIVLVT